MTIEIDSIFSFHQTGQRDNQEDSRFPDNDSPGVDNSTFVVCDGVGGSEKGEIASATVCKRIGEIMRDHKFTDKFTDENFSYLLQQAYSALDAESNHQNKGMATTLTFLNFNSEGVFAAHIGDSRIYQIRPNEGIVYRSEDHSLVNALLRSGNISPDQVKNHPKSNVITRCMSPLNGSRDRDDATVINLQDVLPGDYFLLCSDGVTEIMDDEDLFNLYSSEMSDEEKFDLIKGKCQNSDDNNTLFQICIGGVSINPEHHSKNEDETEEGETENITTQKFYHKENLVHDLAPGQDNFNDKFKKFLSRIFK